MTEWLILAILILNCGLAVWQLWRTHRAKGNDTLAGELLSGQLAAAERTERTLRSEIQESASTTRLELAQQLSLFQQTWLAQAGDVARLQGEHLDSFRIQLSLTQQGVAQGLQHATQALIQQTQAAREAQDAALQRFADAMNERLRILAEGNERRLEDMRSAVERKLTSLQEGNETKLEQMRATVDEKLHATLEQRLGESFKQVADRLEQVHKGLGEMQMLARDVGSLNRVLTNVKSRGVFGEVQLAGLLEQVLTVDQFGRNVETVPGSGARVEFAVRLPGRREDGLPLWLPIDAKFPREDYERLQQAQDRADPIGVETAARAIEMRLRAEARTIREKYVSPPHTTDFAILFLPTEGLYAEALRRPGLMQSLQRDHNIMLAGPTTLLATLSSLQMGFRTLALEKRSSEVWEVLAAVKTEFAKFGDVLDRTKKKLVEASNTIDDAGIRARAMARQLKSVEAMPQAGAQTMLALGADEGPAEELP